MLRGENTPFSHAGMFFFYWKYCQGLAQQCDFYLLIENLQEITRKMKIPIKSVTN